ncbi:hypothetical protein D3C72_1485390 [compost metagenome]
MGNTDFTNHCEATGTHDLVEEVSEGRLELCDFLAAVAVQVLPRRALEHGRIIEPGQWCDTSEQNIGRVQLHRRVGAIAEFTAPGGTGRQRGGEAQAVQADVFWILDEVLRVTRDNQWTQTRRQRGDPVEHRLRSACGTEDRCSAVVVHEIRAEFGVQRLEHIAERNAELSAIPRITVGATAHQHTLIVVVDASGGEQPLHGRW